MAYKVSRRNVTRAVVDMLLSPKTDTADVMRALAAYLVAHNMIKQADMVVNDIAEELFVRTGRLTVEVSSAHDLTDEARQQLQHYLQQLTDAKTVTLYEQIDSELLGGLTARTATAELDVSVKSKLRQLMAIAT